MTPTSATGNPEILPCEAGEGDRGAVEGAEPGHRRLTVAPSTPLRAVALPREGRGRMGFTLVEMMVTVAVIGLAATAVVLAAPDPTPRLPVEAERLAARLVRAREEAILTNRPVAVDIGVEGYGFRVRDEDGWTPLTDGPFERVAWEEGTRVESAGGVEAVMFDPVGLAEPARLSLSRDRARATVTVDLAGEVRLGS